MNQVMPGEQAKFQFTMYGGFHDDAEKLQWLNNVSGLDEEYNNVKFEIHDDVVHASFDIDYIDNNKNIMLHIMYLIENVGYDINNYVGYNPVDIELLPDSIHIIREPLTEPYIDPKLYNMTPKQLKSRANILVKHIEIELDKLKSTLKIDKNQKTWLNAYDQWLENKHLDDREYYYYTYLPNILTNTTKRDPEYRLVDLKHLIFILNVTKTQDYNFKDDFTTKISLIIMSNYKI